MNISPAEFQDQQNNNPDLRNAKRAISRRKKSKKSELLTTRNESTETEVFLSNPQVLNAIKEGIEDVRAGRVTSIRDLKNIWADIL
ncbi:hypothetical protein ACWKW6_26510 [Dyadobacter jiangsuensis]